MFYTHSSEANAEVFKKKKRENYTGQPETV